MPASGRSPVSVLRRPGDATPRRCATYVDAVNTAKRRVTTSAAHGVLERLRILISREILAAAESRRSDGRLEFHDLLVLARTVLHDSDRARRSLHDRYRCLLLDEFQDTDPIQIELAVQIAGAIDGDERRAWSDVLVESGRLFFVGDPKQSIYRFRRADIELFLAARDRYGADDCLVRLSTNFRTVEPIVNWVNQLFLQLMPEENPGRQPKYEPLTAYRQPSAEGDHRPVRLGGPHSRRDVPPTCATPRRLTSPQSSPTCATARMPGRCSTPSWARGGRGVSPT